jgi:hypothetical protein
MVRFLKVTYTSMDDALHDLQEFQREQAEHCLDPLFALEIKSPHKLTEPNLPYHDLGPRGLERLCFQLLVEQGEVPRFFGKLKGAGSQAQYGIDLVAETPGQRRVYQCKNLDHEPTISDIRRATEKFTRDWLGKAHLPAPHEFVYCCPQPFDDSDENRDFIKLQEEFKRQTGGVGLTVWHRAYFDSRLRWLPDLVAGFFSDDHAIRFCDTEDWRYDLLVPVISNRSARHRLVERWLTRRSEGKVFVLAELEKQFGEAFSRSSTLLIRGVPGSGKTTTTLEIATRLLDQQRGLRHRIYYAQLSDGVTVEALVQAI